MVHRPVLVDVQNDVGACGGIHSERPLGDEQHVQDVGGAVAVEVDDLDPVGAAVTVGVRGLAQAVQPGNAVSVKAQVL